jgi:3-hydroxybutyryl-CoA dehydrogenase
MGLDSIANVRDVMFDALGEPRFKAPSLLKQLVAAGRLGRTSSSGFYRREGEQRMKFSSLKGLKDFQSNRARLIART